MEFLYEYGLFLAKAITIVIAIGAIVILIAGAAVKQKSRKGELEIDNLSEHMEDVKLAMQQKLMDKEAFKKLQKQKKKEEKTESKEEAHRLFVIDFNGSMDAKEVDSLREEVSAILAIAGQNDEVLIRLESPGGVVHGYGLASAQLARIRENGIKLTVAVDKVAASGGYMMACVADEIVAAPFSIIGSIGVIAQLPNFNKLLKKNDIEFEQMTAGEYKRTLTIFGENTDKAREKFQQELEETHVLFKGYVSQYRSQLDIEEVATGEHWFAKQAIDMKLVDKLKTSDDLLLEKAEDFEIIKISFKVPKNLTEKFGMAATKGIVNALADWQNRSRLL